MDFNSFNWKQSKPDDPSYFSRSTFAGQTFQELLNRFSNGEQTIFLGVQVTFTKPVSLTNLLAFVRETWGALRFDVPTIAAQTEFDDESWNVSMAYRLAKSGTEVKEWAERTVRLADSTKDLDELRYELGKKKMPEENGDQTFLYIIPTSNFSYGLLIHSHHIPFDGTALQMIMNDLLTKLIKLMANPAHSSTLVDSLAWGAESKNLTPPTSVVVGPAEATEGPLYQQGLENVIESFKAMPRGIGLKPRNVGPGPTRRTHLSFSEEETTRLVEAVRALGHTVTEFAHAAVCVLCYLDNPTTEAMPSDAAYVCFGLLNGRERFLPQYKNYLGYGLGIKGLVIPASVVVAAAPKGEKVQLIETAKAVKVAYKDMKTNPALVSCQPEAGVVVLNATKAAGTPQPNFGFSFSGDGVMERYINRMFEGPDNQIFATVDDLFTSLNQNSPGPFFRIFTWRGKLRLTIDANEYAMPNDVVQGFVQKWASLLRLIL